jgi:hypothetical protein
MYVDRSNRAISLGYIGTGCMFIIDYGFKGKKAYKEAKDNTENVTAHNS